MTDPTRSRTTFRWMRGPVLSHHVPTVKGPLDATVGGATAAAFGRGLYSRKLAQVDLLREPEQTTLEPGRAPRTLLRWQLPLRYLILWQVGGFTLTWHAPWCRRCDCPGAGWRFSVDHGYVSGLGFELSYFKE